MLIDFRTLWPKWGILPKGVCHIGGNRGEEYSVYMELGVKNQVWFEANPEIFPRLQETIFGNIDARAYNFCIGDENKEVVLHVSNNDSQSSSILELGTHKISHPEVYYIKDIKVNMYRLDRLFQDGMNITFDFLNIDVQGAELKVLKGMGDMLHQIKWAYLEVNKEPLYVDCALVEEIDEYISKFGFERVETMWCGNTGWGDACYIKK